MIGRLPRLLPLLLLADAAAASKVLVVGDSMGEFSCGSRHDPDAFPGPSHLQEFCPGAAVTNMAVSGSTAWSWRADGGANSVAAAFDAAGAGVTHVWLSVGGNDFMQPQEQADGAPGAAAAPCQIASADLSARIQAAVDAVKSRAAAETVAPSIILTGYCVPHRPECGGQTDASVLQAAYTQIAASNAGVEYKDISTACGGSNTQAGDAQYFVDPIHLNKRGYCAAFTQADVFSAFGCDASAWSGGSVDCSTVDAVSCTGVAGGDADLGTGETQEAGAGPGTDQGDGREGGPDEGDGGAIDAAEFNAHLSGFNPAQYPRTMTLSALVTVSGVVQANGTLVALEEATDTIRGVQRVPSFPPFGTYASQPVFQIMLYGPGGGSGDDMLRFVFVSGVDLRVAHLQETVAFVANGNEGSATEPLFLTDSVSTSSGGGAGEPQEGAGVAADAGGGASGVYTFPVKSANLDAALPVAFYTVNNADMGPAFGTTADLHAVHGCQTADGGYVMCGKGLESDESPVTESFCIKYDGTGATVWGWSSGWTGSDAANAVVPVSDTEVAVVGWKTEGSDGRRYITKLNAATGTPVWTTTDFANAAGTTSFFEMIHIDGNDVYLAGGINKADTGEMSFKSYGNVPGGEATVEKMPLTALAGASAPAASDVAWTSTRFAGYLTAKAARPVGSGGNVAVLLFGEASNKHASLALIRPTDGSVVWGPTNYDAHGEGTDMQVAEDGASVVIAGQGGPAGELNGRLTKVAVSDTAGTRAWTKEYSSCGPGPSACNKNLILNECWGVTKLADGGFALACGTGIEGCNGLSGQDATACDAGDGDTRPGAYKRGAGIWQSMVVRTDANGEQRWLRVDSYKAPEWPALGAAGWTPSSSAAEWAVATADGGLAVITDQVSGTGLLKLGGGRSLTAGAGSGPCAITDGTAANPAKCTCGTTVCDAATGLFCDVSKNQCDTIAAGGSDLGHAGPGSSDGGPDDDGAAAPSASPGSGSTAAHQYCGPGTEFVASAQKCEVTYRSFAQACAEPSIGGPAGCSNVAMAADC